jgi:RimJ/RimL family protein N-acetyltransferase
MRPAVDNRTRLHRDPFVQAGRGATSLGESDILGPSEALRESIDYADTPDTCPSGGATIGHRCALSRALTLAAGAEIRVERVRLEDATDVVIRPLERSDREALTDLYGRLGKHSRYHRFFACPERLPSSWADGLLDLSPGRRIGLVAVPERDACRIVALADYTVARDGDYAEIGCLVEDTWQNRGLGRVLFERLLALAAERGLRVFVAYVHGSNRRAIHALSRVVTILERTMDAGVLKVTFTRSPEDESRARK